MLQAERLAGLAPFRHAPPDAALELARVARELRFDRNDVIFRAGSAPRGWYVILDGGVRVVRTRGGRQHVVHSEGAGGTLGEVPLFAGGAHPATAIATEPTTLAFFAPRDLERAMATSPAVARVLLRCLALRVRNLVERLDSRSARGVAARLTAFLLQRSDRAEHGAFTLGLTLSELAEELGTVREVVSRELLALRRRGIIQVLGRGRYRILDRDALIGLVEE